MFNSNCKTYRDKLEELRNLYNQFQGELKTFSDSKKSENIWEIRKKIEEIIEFFEKENFLKAKPFSEEELKTYLEDERRVVYINENITKEELERFLQTPDIIVNLTKIPQELKNKIKECKGNIDDFSSKFNYPNLQLVGGSLHASEASVFQANSLQSVVGVLEAQSSTTFEANSLQLVGQALFVANVKTFQANSLQSVEGVLDAEKATSFQANSLQSVVGYLDAQSSTTFQASNLKEVKKIFLTRSKIKDEDITLPEETKKKIEWI